MFIQEFIAGNPGGAATTGACSCESSRNGLAIGGESTVISQMKVATLKEGAALDAPCAPQQPAGNVTAIAEK